MKIGFFITARLKSSRLRHKILLDLNGKPIIERVIQRCKATAGVDGVVLCTSTNPQDSALYEFAQKEEIQFYAGSEDDVLQRLLDAAKYFHYDAFLSITADNPLFSIYTSQLLVDSFKREPFDFGFTKGLPIGLATSLLETKALDVAVYMKSQTDTEIWGPFLNRPDFFNIFELIVENAPFEENKRLTVDYPEDYLLMCEIYNSFEKYGVIDIHNLGQFLEKNNHLWEINRQRSQKWPTQIELGKIDHDFENAKGAGSEFAEKSSKNLTPRLKKETICFG
jgi:spore coat polysaccharide biosynthesis protein SpsF